MRENPPTHSNDFFRFAEKFGKDPTGADAIFDLNNDGRIDFQDFFAFSENFGKGTAKQLAATPLAVSNQTLRLKPILGPDDAQIHLALSDPQQATGYGITLDYDHQALHFRKAQPDDPQGLTLVQEPRPGQLILGHSWPGHTSGDRLKLFFDRAAGDPVVRIRDGVIHQADGRTTQLQFNPLPIRLTPRRFALGINHPNPFNPETTITYELPYKAEVKLEIYDLLGQKIRTLASGIGESGYHRTLWDGRDDAGRTVASGVYIYTMQAGDFVQARKMVLLR